MRKPSPFSTSARVALGEFLLDVIDEIGRVIALGINFARVQRLADGRVVGALVDVTVLEHRGQHFVAARPRGIGMVQRIEPVGRADQAGDSSHFTNSQIARLFREVVLTRFPHAIYAFLPALPQVYIVNIVLEDFVLRVIALRDVRHHRFLDLALVAALARQEKILHQLLRQRRSALAHVARGEIDVRRLDRADDIDAVMLVESMILGRQDRIDHRRRNLAETHQPPLLPFTLEDAADEFGFELDRENRFIRHRIAHRVDRIALEIELDEFAAEISVRIREAVQKNVELAALLDRNCTRRGWRPCPHRPDDSSGARDARRIQGPSDPAPGISGSSRNKCATGCSSACPRTARRLHFRADGSS